MLMTMHAHRYYGKSKREIVPYKPAFGWIGPIHQWVAMYFPSWLDYYL